MTNKKISRKRASFVKGETINTNPENIVQDYKNDTVELPDIDNMKSIEDMFINESANQKTDVNELFHEDKVKTRTDLSTRQTKLMAKANLMADLTDVSEIKEVLLEFMKLKISDNRKSRAEFVEGLKAKLEQQLQAGMTNIRGTFGK